MSHTRLKHDVLQKCKQQDYHELQYLYLHPRINMRVWAMLASERHATTCPSMLVSHTTFQFLDELGMQGRPTAKAENILVIAVHNH